GGARAAQLWRQRGPEAGTEFEPFHRAAQLPLATDRIERAGDLHALDVIARERAPNAKEYVAGLLLGLDGQLDVAQHQTAGRAAGKLRRIDKFESAVGDCGLRGTGAVTAWQRQQVGKIPAAVRLSLG